MGISPRRYRTNRQDIMDKVKTKAQDRQIVYNLSESKRTEFASMGIFVLIIVNFILLWLFPLSTIIANFLITLRQENNNGHPGGSYTGGVIQAERLEIEINQAPLSSNEPKRVKLYNMATLPQKIQLWLIVGLSLGFLITYLTSIASSFHLLPESNSTFQCPPRFYVGSTTTQ